jgi:hypothetical protein
VLGFLVVEQGGLGDACEGGAVVEDDAGAAAGEHVADAVLADHVDELGDLVGVGLVGFWVVRRGAG